ncbi:hypothetical protein Srot_2934 [Segniliparus rotundus DSM 44985]|uniref:Uncharacterized protein n=1 Tax=Segniliparus rotundus (strain ATCC BAA-972 / CDC 1076 / CIP 108378 / DSM 44985 / JCM 13578) TaxID=640132 RepID=D6ZDV6_SEGRD|nr:hypothetical protein [Segniliparus rotundus]ADG99363.1 hypothetical protein Srot_2934 [Segniliparus rotundus DSM 44985]
MTIAREPYEADLAEKAVQVREALLKQADDEREKAGWHAGRDEENLAAHAAFDSYALETEQTSRFVAMAKFEARSENPVAWLTVDSQGYPVKLSLGHQSGTSTANMVIACQREARAERDWRVRAVLRRRGELAEKDQQGADERDLGSIPDDDMRDALMADREIFEKWLRIAGDSSHADHALAVAKLHAYLDGSAKVHWIANASGSGACCATVDGTGLVTSVDVSGFSSMESLKLGWLMRWTGFRAREWRAARVKPLRGKLANLGAGAQTDLSLLDVPEPPLWPEREEEGMYEARDRWLAAARFDVQPDYSRGYGF